ncbi:class I SAM-dependent methyltransferase [Egicoccus halophilus]|uniref:Methyltransferase n=1 Tax=Egicoccus halophilus TaxID=1670830 RepID=A0A8J3A839_9ACTN|nr:class I SAM-dependent methyltransferase [Egicoccus halophilus]GGI06146.1 methyltransferase [Egicoccus halophilus]
MSDHHPAPAVGPGNAPAGAADGLVLTGERTLPGIADENYWFQRHVVAYELAVASLTGGEVVLDAGCGEGYGLAMLAGAGAARVVGVDLDPTVVAHARTAYAATHPAVEVHAAELLALPLADDAIDLTVSFQVVEHLYDIPGYLRSLRRVTRPGATVMIATPNRLTFTSGSDVPVNPFHTREFTAAELHDELTDAGLEVQRLLGVHAGAWLTSIEVAAGRPLPDLLAATDPARWPHWLRRTVHAVTPAAFAVHGDDLDASLDLVAVCRVPG